jgi:phosphocarrier protein HPr
MILSNCDEREHGPGVNRRLELSSMTCRLKVENQQGLHARPAVSIVRLLKDSRSSVTFTYRRHTVNASSVMGLLMLGAPRNAWITVSVDGPDANDTIEKLEVAFRQRFGEQG